MQHRLRWLQKPRLTPCSRRFDPESVPRAFTARRGSGLSLLLVRRLFALAALVFTGVTASPAWSNQPATGAVPSGDLAEFIVNIARYSSWPKAAPPKSLTICYAHGGALPTTAIAADQVWSIKGLPVVWHAISSPQQTAGCNIVWLNSDVRPAPREWLNVVNDQPILTLSNYADFTADGGIIRAYRAGSDWRFEVNLEALQRSRVNIAAVALRLSQKPRMAAAGGPER